MTRKEVIGDATLYLGDCLEILPTLPKVDAVITDPPYCSGAVSEAARTSAKGQGLRSENIARMGWFVGDNMGTAGLVFLLRSVAFSALEVLDPNGHMLFFCDWRMVPNLAPAIESSGARFQNLVVWDKENMGLGMGFRAQHEMILHFSAGSPKYHDLGTSNVIRAGRISAADREHQTQKPVSLLTQLAEVVSARGGLIVDPFMGSGSTGVACMETGRGFVGVERDAAHFATACRRIEQAYKQRPLFEAEPVKKPEQLGLETV
jgi:site-specific DNA-methyltransferase (adenine-specific)